MEYDINTPILKELLVVLMGPITQIIFMFILSNLKKDIPSYVNIYHYFILIFNLLPIYPLDGGKLVSLFLSYLFSFYYSQRFILYLSYFLYFSLLLITFLFTKNLILIIILLLLGIQLIKIIKEIDYYFEKFLLERYLNYYKFHKNITVREVYEMKKDCEHHFIYNENLLTEKRFLTEYFS